MPLAPVPLLASREVPDAQRGRRDPELLAITVVEDPGVVGVSHVARADRGADHELEGLVVCGDEYIHGQAGSRHGWSRPLARIPHHKCEKNGLRKRICFRNN